MPVFAKKKMVIHDDCLSPAMGSTLPGLYFYTLNYSGPNPQKLYHEIKKLLFSILRGSPEELQERNFSWDRTSSSEKFSVDFDLIKDLDTFTFMQFVISLKGEAKPSKEFGREGTATIKIEGTLRTEYPQDTFWQKSILYEFFRVFYHKVIYESSRKRYKEECRELLNRFQDELKSFLNILPKET